MSESIDIFLSLQSGPSGPVNEANALCDALTPLGVSVVVTNNESTRDNEEEVTARVTKDLKAAKFVVIFGTSDYGDKVFETFSSKDELKLMTQKKIPFFHVKMCASFNDPFTSFRIPAATPSVAWTAGEPIPSNLVDEVVARFNSVSGRDPIGNLQSMIQIALYILTCLFSGLFIEMRFSHTRSCAEQGWITEKVAPGGRFAYQGGGRQV